ncbi:hypothetical protein AG1IA_09830 [Rhizoctonia solani AG-1 IA]|uniref:Uncharacterized protein n=1 Tax=Thanatephorus cucumeris (strain AG1-IA) TaxID=983506 RepID=L8WDW5_THACA|nr:hypothetical protein AG1IA_09830 [Rhizoctonia solani AG-1 IA]
MLKPKRNMIENRARLMRLKRKGAEMRGACLLIISCPIGP